MGKERMGSERDLRRRGSRGGAGKGSCGLKKAEEGDASREGVGEGNERDEKNKGVCS